MNALLDGSRQVAPTVDGIRKDHRARYEWAASRLAGQRVVDAACGIGYGSKILAGAGCRVRAFDASPDAIEFARQCYNHDERIDYGVGDLYTVSHPVNYDAVVCFEALEHVARPEVALERFRGMAPRLLVSVPNEEVFPYRGYQHHVRHYTKGDFAHLLRASGWLVEEWLGQEGTESPVAPDVIGRTLVAACVRDEDFAPSLQVALVDALAAHYLNGKAPDSVAIVAMGSSRMAYIGAASQAGGRQRLADEVWAINNMGGVVQCDRVFHMDDIKIQETRAANGKSDVGGMLEWMKTTSLPVYTSRRYDDYPSSVEFPLGPVIDRVTHDIYFNNTTAYAVAFAIALGVKRIHMYGCDFSYANDPHKRERGRGCVEYWLGVANERGIEVVLPAETTLMDAGVMGQDRLYGYDTEWVSIEGGDGKPLTVVRVPRKAEDIPTADVMERRYSHHPALDGGK